ncbi:entericidin A/B family lipoprotein [Alteromonas lipolytica]|uniref:Entericidin EcnAB n=1 Tax=Alteromonas lipolytica TaxID=1856405 RepID=A0A1E8FG58_9ALTE|nr:entericidin A/B family lipoprotein [Alteromonas lipolytica]OFI34904.1 entericidin EcnAB [Alteromonas lipolytica]GGF54966.1 hypothetical protein GCM10011338_03990 [Alteromonas lipolytica]
MKVRKSGYVAFITLVFGFSLLSGCATVEGIGEDVQSAGAGIEEAAEEASN